MFLPALAWRDSSHHLGPVCDGLLRVKRSFFAREALHQNASVFVNQDAHRLAPACAAASFTTFSAASRISSATVKFNPESTSIFRPNSTLVPSMRTTMGTLTLSSRAAVTTP